MNHEGESTWAELECRVRACLESAGSANARNEARWIVEEAAGGAGRVGAAGPPGVKQRRRVAEYLDRRMAGEPLQYVLGHWPFRRLDLLVDRRALIPRPETEEVAGRAIDELVRLGGAASRVVDLGTGTGALALAVATEVPTVKVWAVDLSANALDLANENRSRVGLEASRVTLCTGSWFAALPESLRGKVDIVVTNPPYVATGDEVDAPVREWEPASALFAGSDGLDDLRVIIAESPDWLNHHGVLIAEIGAGQGGAVTELARRAGFATADVHRDLAGHDRMLVARR